MRVNRMSILVKHIQLLNQSSASIRLITDFFNAECRLGARDLREYPYFVSSPDLRGIPKFLRVCATEKIKHNNTEKIAHKYNISKIYAN